MDPKSLRNYIYIIGGPIVIILVWWIFSAVNTMFEDPLISPLFLADPFAVLQTTISLFRADTIETDIFNTLRRVLAGFLLGAVIGVPLGIIIGYFRRIGDALEFIIDFFRSLPAAALFPFFIMVFGVGEFSKIGVAAFSSSLIILVNTTYGVRGVKELRLMAARLFKLSNAKIFYAIILPESFPHIFAGLRIAISYSMILVIFTEMFIGTETGLGKRIIESQEVYRTAEMFAAIILAGILGYIINKALLFVERRMITWEGKA
ncbi:MAG: ABC transporter permease [Candidatus Niyogibacteria bacterium]|nr:ABC transporter permease [Candidatus Niyogibacteria bacterium]